MPIVWDEVAVTDADLDDAQPEEQMGTKIKNWVRIAADERPWLVKLPKVDDRDDTVAGHDWAEWLVPQYARLIDLPAAVVRPATFNGLRASLSRSMLAGPEERLEHGNSLLSGRLPAYVQATGGENPLYTPENVRLVLESVAPPEATSVDPAMTAYDVWAGYLLMDAWLAGQDRHDGNWAAIRVGAGQRLAPSFDHGNALGFQLRDSERARRLLEKGGVAGWASRGRNRYFAGTPSLVELAYDALKRASALAGALWIGRLEAVVIDDVASITSVVPDGRMSEVSRTFVIELLAENRRRLLDGYSST